MKVQVETLSPIDRKLSIEVEAQAVAEELSRAYASLNRRVKVAGFRPGKIPRRILEQRFRSEVEGDVVQRVVEKAYLEAIEEKQVQAVSNPEIHPAGPLQENQPFSFEAKVQVKPELEPKEYTGLSLKKREVAVDDAQVQEQLEKLRQANSTLEPVVDRDVAQAGDFAQIDYEAAVEGKPFPGSKSEGVTVEIAPGELTRGNIEALAGAKVGDRKSVQYTFAADYAVEEVRGKTADFQIELKGLKTKVLPALDDAFAQKVEGGKTLAELKEKIRSDLERARQNKVAQEEREEIITALVAKNSFDVPVAMVDRVIDAMLRGALRSLIDRGVDPRALGLDLTKLRQEMRTKADQEVRGTLLLEAIAQKESLQVTEEAVEKKLEQIAAADHVPLARVKQHFRNASDREGLKLRLREEMAIEFLKSRATY